MSCIFIIPYFGKFKNYFEFFLKSFSYNPQFDLLLITDNTDPYVYPKNVKKIEISFHEFQNLVQEKFDFNISLENPYKLCDYKPAYGYICEQWIKDYDYWGHCDCDLIFGDLTPVKRILDKKEFEKIFVAGHLTIYKNTHENNRIFKSNYKQGVSLYKMAFSSPAIFAFDEVWYAVNVHNLFEMKRKSLYTKDLAYNCSTKYKDLRRVTYDSQLKRWIQEDMKNDQMYWSDGKIYRIAKVKNKLVKEGYIYIHLQMRNMKYNSEIINNKTIKIEGDEFIGIDKLPENIPEYKKLKKIAIDYKVFIRKMNRIKNILLKKRLVQWDKPWRYNPYERKK